MSRIAAALLRAGIARPTPETFHEDDHPWGRDLADSAKSYADDVVHFPSPAANAAAAAEPAEGLSASALARFGPDVRQQLATLIDRVFLNGAPEPLRRVGFASIDTGRASGGLTSAAAELLAQRSPGIVCAVDTHVAAPSLHQHFGVTNAVGLGNAGGRDLAPSDVLQQLRPNLWVVPAGVETAAGQANVEAMRKFLARYAAQFNYLLVNIEPVAHGGQGEGFAALLDGVILVVDAESTRRETARRAAAALRAHGTAVLGAVMTNRHFPIPEWIYRRL